jgi:hypothetical protein
MSASSVEPEWVSVALTALAGVGALVAFVLGRGEYRRAQLWKRKEFVAEAMKDFSADPQVRNALQMIDWAVRRVNLSLTPHTDQQDWPVVTRADQILALKPHILLSSADRDVASDGVREAARDSEKDGSLSFSPKQALIRDTFDALFDAFDRLAGFVNAQLIEVDDLKPYLSYWILDIAASDGSDEDRLWTLAVFAYISFYSFSGTAMLFKSFGHDIAVEGALWRRLAASASEPQSVARLAAACAYKSGTGPAPERVQTILADRA